MTGTFTELGLALLLFIGAHSLPSVRPLRAYLADQLGESGYLWIYSMVSVSCTFWIVVAAIAAPPLELWPMTVAGMWVTDAAMVLSTWLLMIGLTSPNPLSIRVQAAAYDPADPGAAAVTRHPILWSIAVWGLAHLAANGDGGSALLFAGSAAYCMAGATVLDARRRREMGESEWRRLAAPTSFVPFAAILSGRSGMPWRAVCGWRLVAAAAVYVLALQLHRLVLGVSPLPPF